MKFLVFLAATVVAQPPPGPNNVARCPVTGYNMSTTQMYPLGLKNGQTLWFSDKDAAQKYGVNPRAYWLSPEDMTPEQGLLDMPDMGRGLPDMRNQTLECPYSDEKMVINMQTPRVQHKFGQSIYFCCWGCIHSFWADPASAFAW